MKSSTKRIAALKNQNEKLKVMLNGLKASESTSLQNSLSALVQGASVFSQSNLTSFNPIINNNIYAPITLNWNILMYMYKTHGVIQTAIDMPVLDSLRGGLEITSDELSTDEVEELEDDMEEDGTLESLVEATTWKRLFGGAALIVNTDSDPSTPLDYDNLGAIKKVEFYAANRWELMSVWKPNDLQTQLTPWLWAAAKNSEYVYFYGQKLHKSRVLVMSGKAAPYIIRWQLQGWGMSEIERMVEDFNIYIKSKNVLYDLLNEAKTDIYKFKGFNNQLITQGGTEKALTRMALINQAKNSNNAIGIDLEDEYDQKQIAFSGLAEVMKENRIGIASALRMPLTKLFGISSAGFNSGEDDIENYNAMVESEVRQPMRPVLRKILKLKMAAKFGFEPKFKFGFNPLRVMSSVDEETVKTSKQNRYLADYDRGLISSKEYGDVMQKEELIPIATDAAKGLLDDHPQPAAHGFEGDGGRGEGDPNAPEKKDKEKKPEETDNE